MATTQPPATAAGSRGDPGAGRPPARAPLRGSWARPPAPGLWTVRSSEASGVECFPGLNDTFSPTPGNWQARRFEDNASRSKGRHQRSRRPSETREAAPLRVRGEGGPGPSAAGEKDEGSQAGSERHGGRESERLPEPP